MFKLMIAILLVASMLVAPALGQTAAGDSAIAELMKKAWTAAEDPPKTLACLYGTPGKQLDSVTVTTRCYSTFGAIYFAHDKSSWQENDEIAMLCWLLNVKHRDDDVWFLGEMYGIVPARDSLGRATRRPAIWGCWRDLKVKGDSSGARH